MTTTTPNPLACPVCPAGRLEVVDVAPSADAVVALRSCRTCGVIEVGHGLDTARIVPSLAMTRIAGAPGESDAGRGLAHLRRLKRLPANHRDSAAERVRAGMAFKRAAEDLLDTLLEPHPSTR